MVPRLTPVDCRKLVRFFEAHGFVADRQKGSHVSLIRPGIARPVVIPIHSEVAVSVVMNNLRTAGLTRDQLLDWLAEN
jgi:predicted RNA binding protein YcfA (HicA-like mRNA interferase family)